MDKKWWILISIFIIFIIVVFLGLFFGGISTNIGRSVEDMMIKDEIVKVGINKYLMCSCIGLNVKYKKEVPDFRRVCLGIKFDCVERCDAFFMNQSSDYLNLVPCECGKTASECVPFNLGYD